MTIKLWTLSYITAQWFLVFKAGILKPGRKLELLNSVSCYLIWLTKAGRNQRICAINNSHSKVLDDSVLMKPAGDDPQQGWRSPLTLTLQSHLLLASACAQVWKHPILPYPWAFNPSTPGPSCAPTVAVSLKCWLCQILVPNYWIRHWSRCFGKDIL